VGALLDKTRLQGILRGTPSGEVVLEKVMSDETVPPGELVLTSGGDGIFPKGLLVGRVIEAKPGRELFLNIRVHPAADLSRLEEVLVVTKIDEKQAEPDQTGAARAVDILAARLPGVPSKPEEAVKTAPSGTPASGNAPATTGVPATPKPTKPANPSLNPGSNPASNPISNPTTPSANTSVPSASQPAAATSAPASGSMPKPARSDSTKNPPKPAKPPAEAKPQPDPDEGQH
jgi:rod shape-determining protein MreC